MHQQHRLLEKFLTYSGTLPLIACVIAVTAPLKGVNITFIAPAYAAVIISFLSGIHWAAYIFSSKQCPRSLLISSNIAALIAWISLLINRHEISLILQIVCFLCLFIIDLKLRDRGILPAWFYHLRRNATIVVVLCLSTIAALIVITL